MGLLDYIQALHGLKQMGMKASQYKVEEIIDIIVSAHLKQYQSTDIKEKADEEAKEI